MPSPVRGGKLIRDEITIIHNSVSIHNQTEN